METGLSYGVASVLYKCSADAETAIETLNGYSYNKHILTVEWDELIIWVCGHFAVSSAEIHE